MFLPSTTTLGNIMCHVCGYDVLCCTAEIYCSARPQVPTTQGSMCTALTLIMSCGLPSTRNWTFPYSEGGHVIQGGGLQIASPEQIGQGQRQVTIWN